MKYLQQLVSARELLYMMTWRDISIRYKQSIMGVLWAVLMPCVITGASVVVRFAMAKFTGSKVGLDDTASIMIRAVVWAFFVSGIRFGTNSLMGNGNLISKIAFPKEVFPLAAVISSLFDFFIATIVIALILWIMGLHLSLQALWSIPLLVILISLTTGLSLLLSAGNLFYRDVKYLVEIFLTYAIFFTPVLYDSSMLGKWAKLVMWNPAAPILEGFARALVTKEAPDLYWTAYSALVSAALLLVGYLFFKQLETKFAESV
jgi:ABC-type polysaccharide/polyol phosphate export permease